MKERDKRSQTNRFWTSVGFEAITGSQIQMYVMYMNSLSFLLLVWSPLGSAAAPGCLVVGSP